MIVGLPKEIKNNEHRVGLTPSSVKEIVANGHEVFVENNCGKEIGFTNEKYEEAGAKIFNSPSEIYGKSTGCSKGKGGSMQLIDKAAGFMGTSAIVGNSIPLGVGLSLSIKLEQKNNISCIFLGDGAIEEGVFYESINFAFYKFNGIWKKKIIFKRIHGWKYSYNYEKTPYLSIWNKKINLGICGDWLSGPKVEIAWLSAINLARKIK